MILAIRNLTVDFHTPEGVVHAVDHASYEVGAGEVVGVVGESGSGKTVSALAVLGLLPRSARVTSGEILFQGHDLLRVPPRGLRRIRGKDISMVFQDPQSSLNPVFTIGQQIAAVMRAHHRKVSESAARKRAVELLGRVGVPDAAQRLDDYPHQWSGGMSQRAMIAMALANEPKLLIADEPTTALDVTIQAQVLDVLRHAKEETGATVVLITHDLGVVAEMADRVVVMYAGRVVESGSVWEVFHSPRHPYTLGLLASLPRLNNDLRHLEPIPGQPPSLISVPRGCAFHPRCRLRRGRERCVDQVPPLTMTDGRSHASACHFFSEMPQEITEVSAEIGVDLRSGAAG
ncbi:MAG: ABC transporter ATP-binding protein [Actinobacteria bacterium]|nr:ABC transporter ATP-binding protein [Actinomycetota bacterium]MBW3649647.1 ABC transporter ATP-binding protein [Actinomycetota bacterium]